MSYFVKYLFFVKYKQYPKLSRTNTFIMIYKLIDIASILRKIKQIEAFLSKSSEFVNGINTRVF